MHCPTNDELLEHAKNAALNGPVAEHLSTCNDCRRRLESLLSDAGMLEELRSAWADRLDDQAERRIAEICRGVATNLPPSDSAK